MNDDINIKFDENHIISERRQKLDNIRKQRSAYPNSFMPKNIVKDIIQDYLAIEREKLLELGVMVSIAGRIMLKRVMGRASFITIQDDLHKIQLHITKDILGENLYEDFKTWDIGDIIGAYGKVFKTKTDELTVEAATIELISKSIRPLPEKFHGLTNQEQKYRQRYLDLIMNEESQQVFIKRSQTIQTIRQILVDESYIEVETPMMHSIPGGASAKPFVTHHNTLDMPFYLRVAPELYLKRLIIGGLNRVFEINRNFRNEGLSTKHNPEFTMLEFYESYANYKRMMELTENIIRHTTKHITGSSTINYQDQLIDLAKPFEQLTIPQAIAKYNPEYSLDQLNDLEFLTAKLTKLNKLKNTSATFGVLQLQLFEETTESKLINPTYIINYPTDISPLARNSDDNPECTERFELFIAGREIANGYSELNDPEEQAIRFKNQVMQKDSGDEEAMHYDSDYIRALEYGMPHTGGCGIGIDRLVMLLTNSPSIRDVILFPQMKLESNE